MKNKKNILVCAIFVLVFMVSVLSAIAINCTEDEVVTLGINDRYDFSSEEFNGSTPDIRYWEDGSDSYFEVYNSTYVSNGTDPLDSIDYVNRDDITEVDNIALGPDYTFIFKTVESFLVKFKIFDIDTGYNITLNYTLLPADNESDFSLCGAPLSCSSYTNYTACDDALCEWEFNVSTFAYECMDVEIPDYCSPYDTEGSCVSVIGPGSWPYGCYWIAEDFDCMPVDGNCTSYSNTICLDYVGCVINGSCTFNNNILNVGSSAATPFNTTCDGLSSTACVAETACSWDVDECILNCAQFDEDLGGNETVCIDAFGGGSCDWFNDPNDDEGFLCDPVGFVDGAGGECWICHENCFMYDDTPSCHDACNALDYCSGGSMTFSDCYVNDGDMDTCIADPDCVWMPDPYCITGPCYDLNNPGWCNPGAMDFGSMDGCIQYDGDKIGCDNAINFGTPCSWNPDSWGPLVSGTEAGWCNPMMNSMMGCWDYYDEQSCNASFDMGMPCTWESGSGSGSAWCEEKGCWAYDYDQSVCLANADEGCEWDAEWDYCYEAGCWDFSTQAQCDNDTALGLDCTWYTDIYSPSGGWCEENSCWQRDWTNETYCEDQDGCSWSSPYCDELGCWQYDDTDEATCESVAGLNCEWKTGESGWCEQMGCWDYDGTNASACVNETAEYGTSCAWDSTYDICYEDFQGCVDYNNDEFGCYGTGWCMWNPTDSSCSEPQFEAMEFFNPGCWIFDQAESEKCGNVTTCSWNSVNSTCDDDGADDNNGVQCVDINNSEMCNNIPMLATCCKWNGTGCQDAQFSTACWDNMQEPPEGAYFCEDYNAKGSKAICEQIAGDPWYMPCEWDNISLQCGFKFDDLFGGDAAGFDFMDVGSQSNCESMGGIWKSEKWTDPSGAVYTDTWCEMGFGIGMESCSDSCWACEFQDNGSDWSNSETARSACEQSGAGCIFREDDHAFNNYGWCDMDWAKTGNCDQNCWECWDKTQCTASLAGCKIFTDPYNDNMWWCDSQNVKTCDDDCGMCWDPDNCVNSDTDCTWDTNYWFCKPEGTGASASEICFDGMDNDDDTFVDCADPECMFDPFCGGSQVFGVDCLSIPTEDSCNNEVDNVCIWVEDKWDNSWCDMKGAQCWTFDENETACNESEGCIYNTMAGMGSEGDMCDVNFTLVDSAQCWQNSDEADCNASAGAGCVWTSDPWCQDNPSDPWCLDNTDSGWCDHELWTCWQYGDDETACNNADLCAWQTDWFNPEMGWCDPICFTRDAGTCADEIDNVALCQLFDVAEMGWCEPENTFKGCWDKAQGDCEADDACEWIIDPYAGSFCADQFMHDMVGNIDPSPPLELAWEDCSSGANEQNDICFLGLKDDPDQFAFGTGVAEMDETAACAKFFPDSDNRTTKFYWYLDTDGNQTGTCSADDDSSLDGFEFKFKYEAKIQDGTLVETKVAYKCLEGQWSPSQIKLSAWPEKMCYMVVGGVIAVSKEDIDKFRVLGLYNASVDMRIYATTANDAGSDSDVYDSIGPVWYSPGSADFKFENCMGFVDADGDGFLPADDPDCTAFLRYGYIEIEKGTDCNDSIDNDGNGLTDCDDPGCVYDAYYCDAPDDNTAPTITWLNVETFMEGAFIDLNTDEPTNATLIFYNNDSYCANISAATIILDWKLENEFDLDDYDFWHGLPCDQYYFDNNADVSYDFDSNTSYYYKTKVCDRSGNCALSACSSFTTGTEIGEFVVGFTLPPPQTDPTFLMGLVNVKFDWQRDGTFGDAIDGNTGHKINDTTGRDVDLAFTNPNASKQWSIDFKGVDFLKAQSINISDAFIVNETAGGDILIGIKKSKWNEMAQKLGVDYVRIVIPDGIDTNAYEGGLKHCPDNATSVNDPGCIAINMSNVNCTFSSSETICDIPTSIGFSVFAVYMAETIITPDPVTPSSSRSSGGNGVAPPRGASMIWASLVPGKKAALMVQNAASGLTVVSFKARTQLVNAKLEVFGRTETEIPQKVQARVYKYLEIIKTNMENEEIEEIEIQFKVEKSWLEQNNMGSNAIALKRYTDRWTNMPTEIVSESDTYVYYSASLPGFSFFAIGEKEMPVAEPVEGAIEESAPAAEPESEDVAEGQAPAEEEGQLPPQEEAKSKWPISLLIFLTAVIVAGIAYLVYREKRQQQE